MAIDRSFIFNIDLAGPVDPPPLLFHAIRAPCVCGRALIDRVYTFFPSAVFVHGTCPLCGPQQAIFAPEMVTPARETLAAEIARTLGKLTADLAHTHASDPRTVLAAFLDYLASIETDPPEPEPEP